MGNANSSDPSSTKKSNLTPLLQKELRASWECVERTAGHTECIRQFYILMMERGGEHIRRMFAYTDMRRQEHMLTSVIQWTMGENFNEEGLRRIGVLHAHLGVLHGDITIFRDCFVATVKKICGNEFTEGYEKAWTTVFKDIERVMVPAISEAQQVITTITNEESKESEMNSAHRQLTNWFLERAEDVEVGNSLGMDVSAVVAHVYHTSKHTSAMGFHDPRPRTIELRGKLLYVQKLMAGGVAGATSRVIDMSAVSDLEAISPNRQNEEAAGSPTKKGISPQASTSMFEIAPDGGFAVQMTVRAVTIHRFTFRSESSMEHWMVHLKRAVHQFGMEGPAPTLKDIDRQASSIFSQKQHLKFDPNDFTYLTLLGRGSFGKVVKVQHKETNKIYAMKILNKENFHSIRNVIEVRREKAILDSVDHPFIVTFYGFFQSDQRLYFLFDFLSGGELFYHTKIAPDHHFSEDACRFYCAEIACALEHLRVHKIIHRDIKGDNFVLDSEGHVVLTDFGFAKVIDGHKRNTATCGTLAYIAPEIISPTPLGYSTEVDWWSLGVVLFTMLTGFFPFLRPKARDTAKAIVHDQLRFPSKPALSHEARDVCKQLMAKKPQDRCSTLAQVKKHPFFAGFDWTLCEARKLKPPFVPDEVGSNTKYFSKKFTDAPSPVEYDEVVTSPNKSPPNEASPTAPNDIRSRLAREKNVFGSFFFQQERAGSDSDSEESDSVTSTTSHDGLDRPAVVKAAKTKK